jgi:hypothetical protein
MLEYERLLNLAAVFGHFQLGQKMKKYTLTELGVLLGFIVCSLGLVYLCSGGCVDTEGTQRVLRQQGYTEVEITGWRPFAAGKEDFYATGFRAKAPNGEITTGTVTKGFLFKGATVRFD